MFKKSESRYESEKYEKALDIACIATIGLGLSSLGLIAKPIIEKISNMGLLGLIFACEQECEEEILNGVTEFANSEDLDSVIKPVIECYNGKEITTKDCMCYYPIFKKWFK